jgi:hypothetical protein
MSFVRVESRKGTCASPRFFASKTLPRAERDLLIAAVSLAASPSAPDFESRSEPARSTRCSAPCSSVPAERDHHGSSEVIGGHRRSSEVIVGHRRRSAAQADVHQCSSHKQSLVITGHQWQTSVASSVASAHRASGWSRAGRAQRPNASATTERSSQSCPLHGLWPPWPSVD